jgi:hypothetical protein
MNEDDQTIDAQLPGMPLAGYSSLAARNMDRLRHVLTGKGHDVSSLSDEEVIALIERLDRPFVGDGKWHLDHLPLGAMPAGLRAELEDAMSVGSEVQRIVDARIEAGELPSKILESDSGGEIAGAEIAECLAKRPDFISFRFGPDDDPIDVRAKFGEFKRRIAESIARGPDDVSRQDTPGIRGSSQPALEFPASGRAGAPDTGVAPGP